MSDKNVQGVDVRRIHAGRYEIEGFMVEDVDGMPGWTIAQGGADVASVETLSDAKEWIATAVSQRESAPERPAR